MIKAHLRHNVLTVGDTRYALRAQDLEALLILQTEPGVVTYGMLATAFWSKERPEHWAYVVRNAIGRLRKKLRPSGWDIRSHNGVGYSLERMVVVPRTDTAVAKRSTNGWKYVTDR